MHLRVKKHCDPFISVLLLMQADNLGLFKIFFTQKDHKYKSHYLIQFKQNLAPRGTIS